MHIRHIDLETQNHEYLGQKASPHYPLNYIVMAGWRDDIDGVPGENQMRYFKSREEAEDPAKPWFNLDGVDILVAFNAMYEISWFITRYKEEFEKFLKRGGRVVCTQLAEYLLSNMQWTYPALDEVAPTRGGTHKVDGVKLLWEQGVLTSDIDPALLEEYLVGPGGDVSNTALVFYSQMQELIDKGMWRMFLERCEGMLAFAYCEAAGLYVNQDVAKENHRQQLEELAAIDAEVAKLLPELPETLEFNWGSDFHLSALLFGGAVKYQHRVPRTDKEGAIIYEKQDCYKFGEQFVGVGYFPEEGADGAIQAWEQDHGALDRYKSGRNKGQPKIHAVASETPQTKWDDTEFKFPGVIQLSLLPTVLRDKFIGKRPEYQQRRFLTCGTPVYSTSGEVLDALATHGFAAAKLLARRATLDKDNGTYYLSHTYNKDGSIKATKGMLQFVGEDNIIHHKLNMTATTTARLSSSTPNLQNLPRGDKDGEGTQKSRVKEMFTSRFGDDGCICEVDYSSLEVVMLAALSGDEGLLKELIAGTDMHCLRLAAKLKEPYADVLYKATQTSSDPSRPNYHPDHAKYKQMRTEIKPPSFAAQYGASAKGIAFATGVSEEYAQEFLDTEARLFPRAIAFRQVVRDEVTRTGNLPENLCRECDDSGMWTTYRRGYWQAPGGTRYSFRQFPHFRDGQQVQDYKDTQIANYWCQGEAGYMMTLSAGRVIRYLIQNDFFGGLAFLINNVHDALYFDCHKSVAREVGLQAAAIMADAPKYMSEQLGYKIAHVPFPAVAEAGPSMAQKEKIQ